MIGSYNGKDKMKTPKPPRTFRGESGLGYVAHNARMRALARASVTNNCVEGSACKNPEHVGKRAARKEYGAYSRSAAKEMTRMLKMEGSVMCDGSPLEMGSSEEEFGGAYMKEEKQEVFTGTEWNTILPMEPADIKEEAKEEFSYVKIVRVCA